MTLRELVLAHKDGDIVNYRGHKYLIITKMIIEDLDSNEQLMMGIDF